MSNLHEKDKKHGGCPDHDDHGRDRRRRRRHRRDCEGCPTFVVNKFICTKKVQKVAELRVDPNDIGVDVGTGGTVTPAVTVEPNVGGLVNRMIVVIDKIINIGYLPVTVTAGNRVTTLNLPFQHHFDCPGACPEDTVTETPFVVEAIIVQGLPQPDNNVEDQVVIKVILKTTISVVRPVIVKICDICEEGDLIPGRCLPPAGTPFFGAPQ